MSIESKLKGLSEDIRNWAVKRMFEEEGYSARLSTEDEPEWWEFGDPTRGDKELTVDRYVNGPPPGPRGSADFNYTHVAVQGSAVWQLKYDEIDWVDDSVKKFGKGNLGGLETKLQQVNGAPSQLLGQKSWLDETDALKRADETAYLGSEVLLENGISEMENWTGHTAAVFVTSFGANGEKWTEVVQNNYYLSEALVGGIEAQMAIIIAAREDIVTICEDTLNALKNYDNGSGDVGPALAIIGAIVTAGLTAASFGTAAALAGAAFAVTSTLVTAAEAGEVTTGVAKEQSEIKIGGDTPKAILLSMDWAARRVIGKISDKEQEVASKLDGLHNAAFGKTGDGDAAMASFEIAFKEPALNDPTRGELGPRDTEADLHYLTTAATTAFPEAASRVLTAHEELAGSAGGEQTAFNSETSNLPTAVCYPWTALRDLLQDLTGDNGAKVKHTGEVILRFAAGAGAVDDASAAEIEQTYSELDVESSGQKHEPI